MRDRDPQEPHIVDDGRCADETKCERRDRLRHAWLQRFIYHSHLQVEEFTAVDRYGSFGAVTFKSPVRLFINSTRSFFSCAVKFKAVMSASLPAPASPPLL